MMMGTGRTSLAAGSAASQAYTYVNHFESAAESGTGSTTKQVTGISGITAGNLLVLGSKNEGGALTVTGITDSSGGANAWVIKTNTTHGSGFNGVIAYCLSVVTPPTSITVTYSGSATWSFVRVLEFSHATTATYDIEYTAGNGTTPGGAPNHFVIGTSSGTTIAAPGLVVGFYAEFTNSPISLPRVAGNAATGVPPTTVTGVSWIWYYVTSGSVTGAVDCDLSNSVACAYVVVGSAFK